MNKNIETWIKCWDDTDTTWVLDHVHPCLPRHSKKLLGNDTTGNKILIPLCGDTLALKWLADLGNIVIGIEISEKAIQSFFKNTDIVYDVEPMNSNPDGKIFISEDRTIQIFCCDLYELNPEHEPKLRNIDAIWDSASFSAVEPEERMQYGKVLRSFVVSGTTYMLETTDRTPGQGPSYFIPKEEIERSFGLRCVAQQIDYLEYDEIGFNADSEGVKGYFIYWLTFT